MQNRDILTPMLSKILVCLSLSAAVIGQEIPLEEQNKWSFVTAYRRNSSGERYTGPHGRLLRSFALYNKQTGDFYEEVSEELVAFKCLIIAATVGSYAGLNASMHLFKPLYDIGAVSYNTYCAMQEQWDEGLQEELSSILLDNGLDLTMRLGRDVYEVIGSPFYGSFVFLAALWGIVVNPYDAQEMIAWLESFWHWGNPAKNQDVLRHYTSVCESGSDWAIYLAYCMQKIGNIADKAENGEPKWEIIEYKNRKEELELYENLPCRRLPIMKSDLLPPASQAP